MQLHAVRVAETFRLAVVAAVSEGRSLPCGYPELNTALPSEASMRGIEMAGRMPAINVREDPETDGQDGKI